MLRRILLAGLALTLLLPATLSAPASAARAERPDVHPDPRGFRGEMIEMRRDGELTREEVRRIITRAALELAGVDDVPDDLAGYGYLLPAGDLDGDGQEDAIESHWGEGISAVRGTDGESLWRRDFTYEGPGLGYVFGFAIPSGDLDGEGGDDLIEIVVEETDLVATYPWKVTYSGVRGSDGATLWTASYDNPWVFAGAFVAYAYVDIGFPVPLDLAPDADGDGSSDLLHARFDIVEADGFLAHEYRERATMELISGRTGALISTFTLGPVAGYGYASVIPDITGDGLSDIVSTSEDWENPSTTIAARGGQTGTPLWERTVSEGAFATGLDLDGGTAEILLETTSFGETETTAVELLEGSSGATTWSGSVPGFAWSFAAGDATGDGTQELLVVSDQYDWDTDQFSSHLRLVNGSDGSPLWSLDGGIDEFAWPAGDTTGDGVTDATLQAFSYDEVDDGVTVGPGAVVSGADGSVVWSQETGSVATLVSLEADLDGDGLDDLLALDDPWETTSYAAVSGGDGASLWETAAQVPGVWLILPGDVAPSPGTELLESVYDSTEDADVTGVRSGTDGSRLWERRFRY